jgi:hypothetical protein
MQSSIRRQVLGVLVGWLAMGLVHAAGAPERVFSAGFEDRLVINGSAGYSVPLAGAEVELRFGEQVNVARAREDGSFSAAVELDQLTRETILELTARGSGAQSSTVWASPLGPAGRLLDLAGPSRIVDPAVDPYARLSPRTTVDAAVMRTTHGSLIMEPADFYRAARQRSTATRQLMAALSLVEAGYLALPDGVADTWAAVADPVAARALRDAYRDLFWQLPDGAHNLVDRLPTDPVMFPAALWQTGHVYSRHPALQDVPTGGYGFTLLASGDGQVILNDEAQEAPVVEVQSGDQNDHVFRRFDGSAFRVFESWPFVNGEQVRELQEVLELRARLVQGPGGLLEIQERQLLRLSYPDNPDLQPVIRDSGYGLSLNAMGGDAPQGALPTLPAFSNGQFVLPTPILQANDVANGQWGGAIVDIHAFAPGSGTTDRLGLPFSWSVQTDESRLALTMDGWDIDLEFTSADEPAAWSVRLDARKGARRALLTRTVLEVTSGLAWTAAEIPGSYHSGLYGCHAAYSTLEYCQSRAPFTFLADGSMTSWVGYSDLAAWDLIATWNLGTGEHAGRLLMGLDYQGTPEQRRGWQLLRQDGAYYWVLENFNYTDEEDEAAPVDFGPTSRLIRYRRVPATMQ